MNKINSQYDGQIPEATAIYINNIDTTFTSITPSTQSAPSAPPLHDQTTGIRIDALDRFRDVVEKYTISMFFALKLRQLEGYEICIICDDSGSMTNLTTQPNDPFMKVESRWQEAQKSLKIVTDISSIFDPDGIDIYYLNRNPILKVGTAEELNFYPQFNVTPNGSTPLGETIQRVLTEKAKIISERKMLLIIFTDGEPNNMQLFKSVLANRKPIDNIFVTIVACTDDDKAVGYLNGLDKQIRNLDVCDDYLSEMKEIKRVQGQGFNFTFGDYITKILLGSIDGTIDLLDEKKINQNALNDPLIKTSSQLKQQKKSGCIIC